MNNEKRMNKEELLSLLKSLKLSKDEFYILSSGSLVLRDILKDAGDLDINVSKKGLEELKKNYNLTKKRENWYQVNDKIECVCDGSFEKQKENCETKYDYKLQNINDYLNFLTNSSREKDKQRIPIVTDYINKKSNYKSSSI